MERAVGVHEAKTNLSKLLARVAGGEVIVISRGGQPVARLVPVDPPAGPRVLGRHREGVWISPDFDAPLPEDILQHFR